LQDNYEKILKLVSEKLPNKNDVELLKRIVVSLKEGGPEAAQKQLKQMISDLSSD
jgi:hypothetical protein